MGLTSFSLSQKGQKMQNASYKSKPFTQLQAPIIDQCLLPLSL